MMLTKPKILEIAGKRGKILSKDFVSLFGVSRQYVSVLIAQLVETKQLIKIGSTKNTFYVLPEYAKVHPKVLPDRFFKKLKNLNLEEHEVFVKIKEKLYRLSELKENIQNVFNFAFSEMLNNAIEHSQSKNISVEVSVNNNEVWFIVNDTGVGVFRNVVRKKRLKSELEAIQDILKGKTTTIPRSHSGQGIFFTSKASDVFVLDSFGYQLTINNKTDDVTVCRVSPSKRGTRVIFRLKIASNKHLSDIFKKYTNLKDGSDYGFDKTEIQIKLYTAGDIYVSRSQARRILHGLEKFRIILFDFDKVPAIGQAFADEVYRVFHNKHPNIEIQEVNINEVVKFMIERAKNDATRS
ncbi:MAG: DUF4325 domain-containing protein [Patescibacteria group bacterium]